MCTHTLLLVLLNVVCYKSSGTLAVTTGLERQASDELPSSRFASNIVNFDNIIIHTPRCHLPFSNIPSFNNYIIHTPYCCLPCSNITILNKYIIHTPHCRLPCSNIASFNNYFIHTLLSSALFKYRKL